MKKRFEILLGWLFFVPFIFIVGFLFIPIWVLYGIDTFRWLDYYIDCITNPTQTG